MPVLTAFRRAYTTAVARTQLAYHVPRNARGSIPVYTDIRNAGSRHLTLIRNIEGDANALAQDLQSSLHPKGSYEARRMRVHVLHNKHVALAGGLWKNEVIRWLVGRGF
ncbi:ribosomal protein L49/IMG2 [Fomitopsis betulina]|nr:ribosomal protein L49/IMG2 [Fomitopsis betulina]